MASSGNFPVFNDLFRGGRGTDSNFYGIITEGNTRIHSRSSADALQICTFEGLKTGKWYWEWCLRDNQGDQLMHSGAADSRRDQWNYAAASATYGAEKSIHFHTYNQIVEKNGTDTGVYSSSGSSHSTGDVFGIALDTDNGKFYVHKNGTYYASGNPATGANPGATWTVASEYTEGFTPYFTASGGTNADGTLNFGQDSSFGGAKTSGTANASDGNGFGDFYYSPPTGFLAICSANLPISANIDPATTDDNHPTKNFNALIYSGDATSSNAITGLGFQPDLVWIKERGGTNLYSHSMHDTSRGRARVIFAEDDREEDGSTSTQDLVSFDTDGFTVGTSSESKVNGTGSSFISWNWRSNAGTTATNTSGTITSTVQANQDLGFSIVTWTGTGTASTVGHGLSAAPDCIWVKNRSDDISSDGDANGQNWAVYHSSLGNTKYLSLNTTSNASTSTNWWNNTSPTSSVFTVGTDSSVNESSHAMIAYCWHNVEGFQKFGSYIGNGNSDGPFIYTGFRPRLMMLKMSNGSYSEQWEMWDSVDDTKGDPCGNTIDEFHRINEGTESTSTSIDVDFLSNGFKIRGSNSELNQSSKTIVYFAWADVPFKYGNTF